MRTYLPKKDEIERKWWLIDAEGKTLGRLATEIARLLRGKHKRIFTPFLDTGDFVIVINAEKVKVTGKKMEQKGIYPKRDAPAASRKGNRGRCMGNASQKSSWQETL